MNEAFVQFTMGGTQAVTANGLKTVGSLPPGTNPSMCISQVLDSWRTKVIILGNDKVEIRNHSSDSSIWGETVITYPR
jgi:hypothetical protein